MHVSTTNAVASSDGVKVLVYSGAGEGKTILCATAPAPCIISAESGLLSLRQKNIERIFGVATPGIAYDIPVIQVSTIQDLHEAYSMVVASSYGTVCLDSLTEIAEVILASEKLRVKDPRKAYGEMMDQVAELVKAFRDIKGKHVYMSAKIESVKDELTGAVRWGPAMPGAKLAQMLPYYFDEVWRLGVGRDANGKATRYLQTQPDSASSAKDRSGALELYELPNLGHCFSKILGD